MKPPLIYTMQSGCAVLSEKLWRRVLLHCLSAYFISTVERLDCIKTVYYVKKGNNIIPFVLATSLVTSVFWLKPPAAAAAAATAPAVYEIACH